MTSRARCLAFLVAAAALMTGAADADAFCRSTTCTGNCPKDDDGCKTTGVPLAWPGQCVGVSFQRDGSQNLSIKAIKPAIEAALATWSGVTCPGGGDATIAFAEQPDAACHSTEFNKSGPNANILMFDDDSWRYAGADNTLAKTTVSFDPETGEILDADIEFNFAYNEFTVGDAHVVYDLQAVATHELGHFIGLDHSPFPDATMNATYDPGTTDLRTLADDDIAAACAVYAPSRQVACDPTPKNGFSSECGGHPKDGSASSGCSLSRSASPSSWPATVLALFLLSLRRRARR